MSGINSYLDKFLHTIRKRVEFLIDADDRGNTTFRGYGDSTWNDRCFCDCFCVCIFESFPRSKAVAIHSFLIRSARRQVMMCSFSIAGCPRPLAKWPVSPDSLHPTPTPFTRLLARGRGQPCRKEDDDCLWSRERYKDATTSTTTQAITKTVVVIRSNLHNHGTSWYHDHFYRSGIRFSFKSYAEICQ